MSWGYWAIVTGVAAMVVMLMVCMDFLYSDGTQDQQGLGPGSNRSGEVNETPARLSMRAA